jgi:hypothetical protein
VRKWEGEGVGVWGDACVLSEGQGERSLAKHTCVVIFTNHLTLLRTMAATFMPSTGKVMHGFVARLYEVF